MKVLQILPELNSGGVERGTLEVAAHLVAQGHEALVVSHGGRLVKNLEAAGGRHIAMPVHQKHPLSLLQVRPLRRLFERERPDVVHIRSRVPGWIAWLAWRKMHPATRPRLVSTVHGFYSVNAYSAIMTRGERVIAVSESVRDYVRKNYPRALAVREPERLSVIHRGVDPQAYGRGFAPSAEWLAGWRREKPELDGRDLLLLPGRLTRWKGQEDFLRLVADLLRQGLPVQGVLAGETHPRKKDYEQELQALAERIGIAGRITFLGHRGDLREVMAMARVVFSLSIRPEAFGRVSLEAMALGKPVVAYDHGGVAEQLRVMFPRGLVAPGDVKAAAGRTRELLFHPEGPADVAPEFTLERMTEATLEIYHERVHLR
ncbi:MAG: glycosyltransferase family 4 protein [Opitutaceae bacterium]|jgi:glycosyltransferase involved in cell wall biosynthesis|nr:glycosyltransferase family 4 protein [Opitutaceae bacterium]